MSEIYIWDGDKTFSLTQNWQNTYRLGPWNRQNELVYAVCFHLLGCNVFVWDGVSFKDGLPDKSTFTTIPEPIRFGEGVYFVWDSEDRLMFNHIPETSRHLQVYRWDGEYLLNMSQNPDNHNGSPILSPDGIWAFVTFFSSEQLIYVRDTKNNNLLVTEAQYSPAWSSDGYLIFCSSGWIVNLWDGQEIIEVTRGHDIWAQWQNSGQTIFCSSG